MRRRYILGWIALQALGWGGGGLFFEAAAFAQDSQACKTLFQNKAYNQAEACFAALVVNEPKQISHLYNRALVFQKWAKDTATSKAGLSCRLRLRAITLFSEYEKKVQGDEQIRVGALLRRLQIHLRLAQIQIATIPLQAKLLLKGEEFEQKSNSPALFEQLCPGTYTFVAEHPGFSPHQQTIVVEAGQKFTQTITLHALVTVTSRPLERSFEPIPKRRLLPPPPAPSSCPNLLPSFLAFGGAALLLGGGITTTALATGSHSQMQTSLSQATGWKAHYQTAVALEWTSGALFVGGGLAAITGTILLFTLKKPCEPAPRTSFSPGFPVSPMSPVFAGAKKAF